MKDENIKDLMTCPFCYKNLGAWHRKENCPRVKRFEKTAQPEMKDTIDKTDTEIDKIIDSLENWYDGDKGLTPEQSRIVLKALLNNAVLGVRIDEHKTFYDWVQSEGRIHSEIKEYSENRLTQLKQNIKEVK